MPHIAIALGSNLGDRRRQLRQAIRGLRRELGASRLRVSRIYETEPVGGPKQRKYLNAAATLQTKLTAHQLLAKLKSLEKKAGRVQGPRFGPRPLDLDLLFYGEKIRKSVKLTIPHPRMHKREFVLRPLAEIAPDWVHPTQKKTVQELLRNVCAKHS